MPRFRPTQNKNAMNVHTCSLQEIYLHGIVSSFIMSPYRSICAAISRRWMVLSILSSILLFHIIYLIPTTF